MYTRGDLRCLLPVVAVGLVLFVLGAVLGLVGLHSDLPPQQPGGGVLTILIDWARRPESWHLFSVDLVARLAWGVSSIAYILCAVLMAVLSWMCLRECQGDGGRLLHLLFVDSMIVGVAAATCVLLGDPAIVDPDRSIQIRMLNLLPTLTGISMQYDPTLSLCLSCPVVSFWIAAVGGLCVRSGCGDVGLLRARVLWLQRLSLVGAALLVLGSVRVFAEYSWASAYIAGGEEAEPVGKIAAALASACGGLYTLVLLAAVGPAYWTLGRFVRQKAREMLPHGASERRINQWINSHAMGAAVRRGPRELLVGLAPLLGGLAVGPFSEYLSAGS